MSKKIEFTINGERYLMEPEDLAKFKAPVNPKSGYERVEPGKGVYYIEDVGALNTLRETGDTMDDNFYISGNYYADKELALKNVAMDNLTRRIRRWQAEYDTEIETTEALNTTLYDIRYDYENDILYAGAVAFPTYGVVYFSSGEKAKEAKEAFKDELLAYFRARYKAVKEAGDEE